ncbi:MAG: PIG-L family deacetylase [Candidatus Roizmanbacteria bacterium]|nr:PIG-L family deacetylase [Candidatus Roizmanbacteria bacterium]
MYYFISPHLDDAILSAGGLINYLKDRKKIKIITVFTEGDKLFLKRRIEDMNVCRYLGIEYLHLGFTDVLWRDIFNLKKERILVKAITNKIKKLIKNSEDPIIFAPLSIGNHIDHRIVNKICKDNFTNVIYWEDYPYNLKSNLLPEFIKKNRFLYFEYKKRLFEKEKLIKFYDSQIMDLFRDKPIILKKEKYYFNFDQTNLKFSSAFF